MLRSKDKATKLDLITQLYTLREFYRRFSDANMNTNALVIEKQYQILERYLSSMGVVTRGAVYSPRNTAVAVGFNIEGKRIMIPFLKQERTLILVFFCK